MADYKVVDKEQLDAGLTTIADAIREKGGTTEELEFPNEMRDAVLAIETGIDTTTEKPATPSDMLKGKEAFANGEPVYGSLNECKPSEYDWSLLEADYLGEGLDADKIELEALVSKDAIVRQGAYLGVRLPCSEFGNATAEDVVKNLTFTSASGFLEKGTMETLGLDGLVEAAEGVVSIDEDSDGTKMLMLGGYTTNTKNCYVSPGSGVIVGLKANRSEMSVFGDTSPSDVAAGKIFTSEAGLAVEGTMERRSSWFNCLLEHMKIDDEGDFCIVKNLDKRYYIEENIGMYFDAMLLGDAKPEDVRAGVHFTSQNGIQMEGTALVAGGETYTGDLYSYGTATATPASGVTQVQFTNIPKEPDYFVVYLDSVDINQYHRVGTIMYDGSKLMGHELYSDTNVLNYYENTNDASDYRWKYTYEGTTLTIMSQSADVGGYFHNPGTYTLFYAYKDNENGTVIIEKSTTKFSANYESVGIPSMKGNPVWFDFMYLGSVATPSSISPISFANEKGCTIVSSSNNFEYTEDTSTYHSYYNESHKQLNIYGSNNSTLIAGSYQMIYAYYPPTNSIVDTSDANATEDKILDGYIGYTNGRRVEGNIPSIQAQEITPSTTAQEIPAGVYLAGKQTIKAIQTETKTVTQNGTVTPSAGKYLSSVTVNVPTGPTIPEGAIVVRVTKGASASTQVGSGYSLSVTYGDSVDIDDSLALAFVGTTKSLSNISSTTDFSVLQGKYIRSGGSYVTTTGTFYYIPTDSKFTVSGSSMNKTLTCDKAQKVSIEKIDL